MANGGSVNLDKIQINAFVSDEGILNFAKTLKEIAQGKDLQNYWKDIDEAIEDTTTKLRNFKRSFSFDEASELVKSAHALQALSKSYDLTELIPVADVNELVKQAEKMSETISKSFSAETFAEAFAVFQTLKNKGQDLASTFHLLSDALDAKNKNRSLSRQLRELKNLIGDEDLEQIKSYKDKLTELQEEAKRTFESFLHTNGIIQNWMGGYDDDDLNYIFQSVKDGSLTAAQAISKVKQELGYLLNQQSLDVDDIFNTEQFLKFSDTLNSILMQVEEVSSVVQNLILNGLPSQTQPSQIIPFESEDLKQISQNIKEVQTLLSSVQSVISDVGDGKEFSPLLQMIKNVEDAIRHLADVTSKISFNLNLDLNNSSDTELERKISEANSRYLQAYRDLFAKMKGTKRTNLEMLKFFEPDDASVSELIGLYRSIISRIEKEFATTRTKNGKTVKSNIYKDILGDDYKHEVNLAREALTRAQKSGSTSSDSLSQLFEKIDLSGVITELKQISKELNNILVSAQGLKTSVDSGFDLLDFSKNIELINSSLQTLNRTLTGLQKESTAMSQIEDASKQAAEAKKDFVTANESVQSSIDGSKSPLELEAKLMRQIAHDAQKAARAKKKFAEANERVRQSAENSDTALSVFNSTSGGVGTYHESLAVSDDFKTLLSIILAANESIDDFVGKYKLLNQIGKVGDNAISLKFQKNDGQIENWYLKKTDEGNYSIAKQLVTDYKNFEKIIISAENQLRDLEIQKATILAKTPDADINNLEQMIVRQREYVDLLDQTAQYLRYNNETVLAGAQIENARKKAAEEYLLKQGVQKESSDAKAKAKEDEAFNKTWDEAIIYNQKLDAALSNVEGRIENLSFPNNLYSDWSKLVDQADEYKHKLKNCEISVEQYSKKMDAAIRKFDTLSAKTYQSNKAAVDAKERGDHEYWQSKFEESVYAEDDKSVFAEMKAFYEKQDKDESKKIWNEQLSLIREYYDERTKLNKLIASDQKSNTRTQDIDRQIAKVEEYKQKAEDARKVLSDLFSPYKNKKSKHDKVSVNDEWKEMMALFRVAEDGSEESIAKMEDAIKKLNNSTLSSINKELEIFGRNLNSMKKDRPDEDQSQAYRNLVTNYENLINQLRTKINELQKEFEDSVDDIIPDESLKEIENLKSKISDLKVDFGNVFKGSTSIAREKEFDTITKYMEKNTRISKEAKAQLMSYLEELHTAGAEADVKKIHAAFLDVTTAERLAGREGRRFIDILKDKAVGNYAAQLVSYYLSWTDLIQYAKRGIETIKEYDAALTEMNKVSSENIDFLKKFQVASFDLANDVGTTAVQIQNSTADFLRLGESFEKASQSAKDANALLKVSEFNDINEATDALVAMSQAYKELEKSEINDILNYTGNNFSISTSELASALQRSAATLKVAGNDIYEATALVTAGNAVLQDAESVGTGLKMISLRILGTEDAKNELASLGENVDDFVVQTKSKLDETVRKYTAVASNGFRGISVLDDNGNYRSTFEILRDISLIYQDILDADKKAGTNRGQALLEVLAGKNRSNVAASILQNPELLTSVYEETLEKSQGSVAKELEAQLKSIESHLNELSNAWDKLWVNENNREIINFFLDLGTGVLNVVDGVGLLNTALAGVGAALGFKNLG